MYCIKYPGDLDKDGYPVIGNKRVIGSIVTKNIGRQIQDDECIYRICNRKDCMNPNHLKVVNKKESKRNLPLKQQYTTLELTKENIYLVKYLNAKGERKEDICNFIKVKFEGSNHEIALPDEIFNLIIKCKMWEDIDMENKEKVEALIKLDKYFDDENKCIEVDFQDGYAYPYVYDKNKKVFAHRYVFTTDNDEKMLEGKVIMHKCDNPRCVRPSHLELGTQKDNIEDKVKKNRQYRYWDLDKYIDKIIYLKDIEGKSFENISKEISSIIGKKVDKKTIMNRYYKNKKFHFKKITQKEIVLDNIDKILIYRNDYGYSYRKIGILLSKEKGISKAIPGQLIKEVYIKEMGKRGLKIPETQTKMDLIIKNKSEVQNLIQDGISLREIARRLSEKLKFKVNHTQIKRVLMQDYS
ncbi:HNH endonuclease signature motif containing protein [Caloramator australicus]|uniref:HNH nuclease domain-containing protein n=1 Tax=Caloramator australicus RC3 TaxID=857293 RepID=I7K7S8_9CLOT|nr:HNH endonuclease signature motif containing protein [Caloramator australicus]CCJ33589.1 hypothetical protein CAAU_1505 [Caloramator australicus RC3]